MVDLKLIVKALKLVKDKPVFRKVALVLLGLILTIPLLLIMVLNSLIGDLASLMAIQKMGEEKYKQGVGAPALEIPMDLLQEYYIPASIEFKIPWSIIAGIHAVQTEFAKKGGLFHNDAFDLPDEFWSSYRLSKRDYDWHKIPRTDEEEENHEHIPPERDRMEDVVWTIAKYLSSIQAWNSKDEVKPKIKRITKFNDKVDEAQAFAWAYNMQYAVSGTSLSLEPSKLALSIIPAEYMSIYKMVEEEYGIPWNYIAAFHYVETRFGKYVNPITGKLMVSDTGGIGHYLIKPAQAGEDPFDPLEASKRMGSILLSSGFSNDVDMAIYAFRDDWNYVAAIKAQAALFAAEAPVSIGEFVVPVVEYTLSSKYGPRWGRMHKGIDMAAPLGTTIYSYAAGKVTFAGRSGTATTGFGTLIIIDHGNGMQTRYGHSQRLFVSAGQEIPAGFPIAAMGSEGGSTGSHLHFEVLLNGNHVDPLPYITK